MGSLALLLAAAVLSSGCAPSYPNVSTLPEGNVQRLISSYPEEAERARVAAPAFTRDALRTISGLEEELGLRAGE